LGLSGGGAARSAGVPQIKIVSPPNASALETLAAREVRRYFYLRTGSLLPIVTADTAPEGAAIIVARRDRPIVPAAHGTVAGEEQYRLRTSQGRLFLVGGGDIGTLYGAYRFAERLGVRFYIHGDVVPDSRIAPTIPDLDETGKPLFAIRGIQPFHDFPEGPDWWNRDDYLAYIAQLPKLRMNFLGLHTYPEGREGAEPAVWIGEPRDVDPRGKVGFSYPAQWANTMRKDSLWGYGPMNTSDFSSGAGLLFDEDPFGPEVTKGLLPVTGKPSQSNRIFNNTGEMLQEAFAEARALGVKTCIGTETPLTIPRLVQDRLKAEGKDPADIAVVRELYEGMFQRLARLSPVDYYWLWTPEPWTWGGNKPAQLDAVARDIQAALAALNAIGKPFTLATSGWVLGPQNDRAALDKLLPKDLPMSCINRMVGHAPDEPGFANVTGRPKWVIPWLENDPDIVAPQPWAGRMRYDAADALRLGCTGLIGIHWRTKILAPNFAALAAAAWDQSWTPPSFDSTPIPPGSAVDDPFANGKGSDHPKRGRSMPVRDFYIDFARASFGSEVAEPAGEILARIDGSNLPEPAGWMKGPGAIKIEKAPWSEVRSRYVFVDELSALRANVRGKGNLARFDYWLNTYRYMSALAEAGSTRGELDQAMAQLAAEKDAVRRKELAGRALWVRIRLARVWERMIARQVAAADTPGELGTLSNLEQHNRKFLKFLDAHDDALAAALPVPLPAAIEPSKAYTGPARIVVPTVRTLAAKGESLRLKIILLDRQPMKNATLFWRPMGEGNFKSIRIKHEARCVYWATLPKLSSDLEYYLQAETAHGERLVWPATAPALNQTVIAR
jgi:hypothetical protein